MKTLNSRILNALLLLIFISCLTGCEKDDPANVTIKVSYFWNDFVGYKPDVGATAYLYDERDVNDVCIDSVLLGRYLVDKYGELISAKRKYEGEADVTGTITITGINPGDYLLMLDSKGRWTFSYKYIHLGSGESLNLVKNFGYLHEYERGGEPW